MARVNVKDFITIDIPIDMEYSDNLDTQLFCALRRGKFAKEMEGMGIPVELEDPYSADRCFILHSSTFRCIDASGNEGVFTASLKSQIIRFMRAISLSEELIILVDSDELIIGYIPSDDEYNLHFGVHVATPKYICYGQLWINDIDEKYSRINEAIRWLETIEPFTKNENTRIDFSSQKNKVLLNRFVISLNKRISDKEYDPKDLIVRLEDVLRKRIADGSADRNTLIQRFVDILRQIDKSEKIE